MPPAQNCLIGHTVLGPAGSARSAEETQSVFVDERALIITDPDHSAAEDRFVLLGLSAALRVLVVVHCYRAGETTIRIISARRATRPERETYTTRWER